MDIVRASPHPFARVRARQGSNALEAFAGVKGQLGRLKDSQVSSTC